MSDLLSIGSSGVTAYQRALATVSNNIANVSTDGYTRQNVAIASNQPTEIGGSYVGTGARFDAVRRQYDAFIESNLRNSNSDLKAQEPLLTYVNRLIDIMGDQSTGLTSAMNLFFESSRTLASDPASTIARSTFLRDADGLAARFRQLGTQFDLLDNETHQAVETDVGQINSLTRQLYNLNSQLAKKSSVDDQPSELLDQRDMLLRDLSNLIAIKTKFSENGRVLVSVGDTESQGFLITDVKVNELILEAKATGGFNINFRYPPVDVNTGKPQALPPLTSGKIGGVLTFREQVLAPALESLDNLAATTAAKINQLHREGLDAEGRLGGDLFGFANDLTGQASGMQVVIQDAARVAAAGQFRIIDDPLNPGSAQARIDYSEPVFQGPTGLVEPLDTAIRPQISTASVGVPITQGYASVGLIKAGTQNMTLTLNAPTGLQSLQVFTRDGRHVLGTHVNELTGATLTKGQGIIDSIMRTNNGMEAGATYSDAYLNKPVPGSGPDVRYLDMDLFMGVKALPQKIQQFNLETGAALDPTLSPAQVQGRSITGTAWSQAIQEGRITLNGTVLQPLTSDLSDLNALAQWITSQNIQGISATVVNDGLRLSASDNHREIRLGLAATGTPADLTSLGFDTSVYLAGTAKDDLLVFVADPITGTSDLPNASITSQYDGVVGDMKQILREQSLEVSFLDDGRYVIKDTRSDTVLAQRTLDTQAGTPVIRYRGLTLEFSTTPEMDDVFRIDGNQDGIGNNEAMLKLADLENSKIMPGGLTLTEAYIERVNQVGNVARQADISKQALTVVNEQAQKARDGVSGVSLDEEAGELVRFQQAYQANAKVMQVASQLFEAILQVR